MVTEVKHYVEKVQKRYPFLSKSEINKILTYGLKMYAFANSMHADVLICYRQDDPMVIHCGPLGFDSLKHYYRWLVKHRMRERVLYKMRRTKWDGYYYIGLNEDQHNSLKKGKIITFTDIYLTKVKKELFHDPRVKHIWRVPYPSDCGWKFHIDKLKTAHAEYLGENQYEKYHQCFLGRTENGPSPVVNQSVVAN